MNYVLLHDVAPTPGARPVLVPIDSNARRGAMDCRLAGLGDLQALPMIRGTLHDVVLTHSAHVRDSGYFAAAPYSNRSARIHVVAGLLDDEQLHCLDETEPNFVCRVCHSGQILVHTRVHARGLGQRVSK